MARNPTQIERPEFVLKESGLQDRFLQSRAKVQLFGGGYGNGKTTTVCIKALQIADMYPGSTGLIARSTYPKLNDTIRKEFLKWCPPKWIVSFPTGQNGSNICELKNGTTIYFRYIAQQGGAKAEQTTSNLLSATYDWIIVDQVEDPEITYKDFLDLFGRLRGRARYNGEDITMPTTGPRWMMLTTNPTGNWVYTKLVRALQMYEASGIITDELLCMRNEKREPILENGKPIIMLELFEGSTYELSHVHNADGGDFIQTLETMYQGQQRDRFLLGKWAAYEGLVYPNYNAVVHSPAIGNIEALLQQYRDEGYEPKWYESYDYGQAQPSCYMLGFTTPDGALVICDGFYQKEMMLELQIAEIKRIREKWASHLTEYEDIYADPNIFTRKTVGKKVVGKSIAAFFTDDGIGMRRGNNDINNGVVKVSSYLSVSRQVRNPFTGEPHAPRLYVSANLTWWHDEISSYYWMQNANGERVDKPVDRNDHAMDATRYILSHMPEVGRSFVKADEDLPSWMFWHEHAPQSNEQKMRHRYG